MFYLTAEQSVVCKRCARLLIDDKTHSAWSKPVFGYAARDPVRRDLICKSVIAACKKVKDGVCPHCGHVNGKPKRPNKTTLGVVIEGKGSSEPWTAVDVLNLFRQIPEPDCALLNMGRPENLLWQHMPVPPVCVRPAVGVASLGAGTHEDDLTVAVLSVARHNGRVRSGIEKGDGIDPLMVSWNMMQQECASFVDSSVCADGEKKQHRGLVQRLEGKHGRFRLNLSGKRCNFTGRSVISPDPNLSVCEVGVPLLVAKKLTIREVVRADNLMELRELVSNGPHQHPGALAIWRNEKATSLSFGNNRLKVFVFCLSLIDFLNPAGVGKN